MCCIMRQCFGVGTSYGSWLGLTTPAKGRDVTADPQDLQRRTASQSVSQWARKNIIDSHKEKRKTYALRSKRQSTRLKRMSVIAAQELLAMMVTTEMTLVVVPPHLPHKEEVMSDLSLPSRPISSHTALSMKTTTYRHHQEFQ
jgi:hypothetical protein